MSILKNIDFMKARYVLGAISAALVLGSIALLFTRGLNLGLDFTGGTLIEVHAESDIKLETARAALADTPFSGAVLQHFGSAHDMVVRVAPQDDIKADLTGQAVFDQLKAAMPELDLRRVEFVGPQVGDELRDDSGLALLMALGFMLVYVWIRFSNKFGVAAVAALFHDVIIVIGAFSLFQWQVDLTVLAALLALIGYSINDSIVIADYVRDTFRTSRLTDPAEVVNDAIRQTMGRTVNTALTTWLVVLSLQFFGGESVHGFSLAMSIGVLIGTYSSIYIVCTIALAMNMTKEDFIIPEITEVDEMP
ncbi:MAG: protein translocase subunit SecF [Gammaproteobacteria bacterium]|jgi:preprotein translocase subunit SecF|nr:protein translocase subunit SecF [Gammaproteobacteria bacterium]MBQ0775864.1 protein translocase subunit SecF [Gammaproteobacteria bacterium]|tara:strand:+ start:68428 stop:69348 length:921 start_codon:yes stop_codon:yes gene_type:complete